MNDVELVIKIPEDAYNYIKANGARIPYYKLSDAIKNGTPLPQNATNGDVIKAMFPNLEWVGMREDVDFYSLDGETPYSAKLNTFKSWWNAPYKAESEEV